MRSNQIKTDYEVYSWSGELLGTDETYVGAIRKLWVWYSATIVKKDGEVVFEREKSTEVSK